MARHKVKDDPAAAARSEEPGTETDPEPETEESESRPAPTAAPTGPSLAERMALPEPARTKALEATASKGEQFYLRSRKGDRVKITYGDLVLTLGKEPKGFSAAHAIHILWKRGDLVEEVEV